MTPTVTNKCKLSDSPATIATVSIQFCCYQYVIIVKQGATLEEFSVLTFRGTTEANLRNKSITDKDRKYIVRTLATILMSYVPLPKLSHCAIVAKALVAKYPFLSDSGVRPHVSYT